MLAAIGYSAFTQLPTALQKPLEIRDILAIFLGAKFLEVGVKLHSSNV